MFVYAPLVCVGGCIHVGGLRATCVCGYMWENVYVFVYACVRVCACMHVCRHVNVCMYRG